MRVRENFVPDRWLFGATERECTSCGIVLHTAPLELRGKPSIVLVEQLDQPGKPWGIPAGRTEKFETDPRQTILREMAEETGLVDIPVTGLNEFLVMENGDTVKIVYSYLLTGNSYRDFFTRMRYQEGIWLTDRSFQGEIGRVAVVPAGVLFSRGHPILQRYYRWDVFHHVKARLEGLHIL